jgi:biopolymer transport protein ExbB
MHALHRLPSWLALAAIACAPMSAAAWWNKDFKQRTKITLNTSAAGVELREAVSGATVPVRLHSGNFDFLAAKPDGADLRFVAGDDKTPLKFWIERFDGINELAVVWVQVPLVAPGSDRNVIFAYAGNDKAAAEAPGAVFDGATVAAFHFADKDGRATDHTGALTATAAVNPEPNGLIGPSARLAGKAIEWPAAPRVQAAAGAPYAVSLWAKPEAAGGTLFAQGPLSLQLEGAKAVLRLGTLSLAGGELPANAWAQLALTLQAGKATLYVNGAQAAQADLPANAPAVEGPVRAGAGFTGLLDELQIATGPRSVDWMKFARAAQAADAKLVAAVTQGRDDGEGGGGDAGYIGVLVRNLTLDAKVVIGILVVMFVIAVWVMVTKALLVRRVDRGNLGFLQRFRASDDVLGAGGTQQHPDSPLARLYAAGCRELTRRDVGKTEALLSGASIDAVKAAVDADLVRESHKLNAQMVLLTIAISGGPFLGLLGTVVGVMITFAAIAAAGDVNVNAIAPGIAAALLATVAGLAVAIPALFGYNYLASRIKNISADMQIFVDEFVTRVAERYGAR